MKMLIDVTPLSDTEQHIWDYVELQQPFGHSAPVFKRAPLLLDRRYLPRQECDSLSWNPLTGQLLTFMAAAIWNSQGQVIYRPRGKWGSWQHHGQQFTYHVYKEVHILNRSLNVHVTLTQDGVTNDLKSYPHPTAPLVALSTHTIGATGWWLYRYDYSYGSTSMSPMWSEPLVYDPEGTEIIRDWSPDGQWLLEVVNDARDRRTLQVVIRSLITMKACSTLCLPVMFGSCQAWCWHPQRPRCYVTDGRVLVCLDLTQSVPVMTQRTFPSHLPSMPYLVGIVWLADTNTLCIGADDIIHLYDSELTYQRSLLRDPQQAAFSMLAAHPQLNLLTVGRWNGDVELWNHDGQLVSSASALVPTADLDVDVVRLGQLAAVFDGAWNPSGTVFAAALKSSNVALFSVL